MGSEMCIRDRDAQVQREREMGSPVAGAHEAVSSVVLLLAFEVDQHRVVARRPDHEGHCLVRVVPKKIRRRVREGVEKRIRRPP